MNKLVASAVKRIETSSGELPITLKVGKELLAKGFVLYPRGCWNYGKEHNCFIGTTMNTKEAVAFLIQQGFKRSVDQYRGHVNLEDSEGRTAQVDPTSIKGKMLITLPWSSYD